MFQLSPPFLENRLPLERSWRGLGSKRKRRGNFPEGRQRSQSVRVPWTCSTGPERELGIEGKKRDRSFFVLYSLGRKRIGFFGEPSEKPIRSCCSVIIVNLQTTSYRFESTITDFWLNWPMTEEMLILKGKAGRRERGRLEA